MEIMTRLDALRQGLLLIQWSFVASLAASVIPSRQHAFREVDRYLHPSIHTYVTTDEIARSIQSRTRLLSFDYIFFLQSCGVVLASPPKTFVL